MSRLSLSLTVVICAYLSLRGASKVLQSEACPFCDDFDSRGVEGIMNLTATSGDRTKLPCSIDSLRGNYKVVWQDPYETTLFLNEERLVEDRRFELERQGNEWNLVIAPVTYSDKGRYRCVANTQPMQKKMIDLHVQVPPKIHRELSSRDVEVTEGANVYLLCNASGVPAPTIRWTRTPADNPVQPKQRLTYVGTELLITNASRYCDDIYECIASNGVEPSDKHSVRVKVRFSPEVFLRTSRIMQQQGKKTTLSCHVSLYPIFKTYWAKDNMEITQDHSPRHSYTYEKTGTFSVHISLHINDIQKEDYGVYKCVAINSIGRAEKKFELQEQFAHHVPVIQPTQVAIRHRPVEEQAISDRERGQSDAPGGGTSLVDEPPTLVDPARKPSSRSNGREDGRGHGSTNGNGSGGQGETARRAQAVSGTKPSGSNKNSASALALSPPATLATIALLLLMVDTCRGVLAS